MEAVKAARQKLQGLARDSINFRLLNALIYAPTEEGVGVIAGDILAASTQPDGLEQLAEFYIIGASGHDPSLFTRCSIYTWSMVKAGGRTPLASYHPSRDEDVKTEDEDIAADLEVAKRDQAAKLKKCVRVNLLQLHS